MARRQENELTGEARSAARARLDEIIAWIGKPMGRGKLVPQAPDFGEWKNVKTFEADGELGVRRVRIKKLLGSGLAGTVYLAEDDTGETFIEKHYGEIPSAGSKKLGRFLTALIFTFFRQAPLSFREIPEAVITSHLANRFIVAFSRAKFGRALCPWLLYSRYDEQTGGYAQAFAFVDGRPLRPWDIGLPLMGEAGLFFKTMQGWRDFLAKDLGFWGLARQVDPANPNSFSNVWITPDGHVLLLDVVPGVPGFLEARYLWWGLIRGDLPPFGDAIDFNLLTRYLREHPLKPSFNWQHDLETLRVADEHWQNSEPRIWSSPGRLLQLLRDPVVKKSTREATVTHLEIKGAISREDAVLYREELARTGKFPKFLRHTLLKMAPLKIHLALTGRTPLMKLLASLLRLPFRLVRGIARRVGSALLTILKKLGTLWKLAVNRRERLEKCRAEVGSWIEEEHELGRMTDRQVTRLRTTLESDNEIADIVNVFGLHLLIAAAGGSLFGSGVAWLGLAIVTRNWWLALPFFIEPALRVVAVISAGLGKHLGLLAFSALPTVGSLAAPLYLLRRRPELGGFMLRSFGRKAALHIPGFGERGSLCEMLGQAAGQTFIVDPAPFLTPILVGVMIGAIGHAIKSSWGNWLLVASIMAYIFVVLYMLLTRRRESQGFSSRHFVRASSSELDPLPQPAWKIGMPEPFVQPETENEAASPKGSRVFLPVKRF